jgi:hypothetical protein
MKLDLWKRRVWQKTRDYTLEETFYLCDSLREAFDLPPLSLAAISAAKILYNTKWALCGGTAVSKLVRPRTTSDIDILAADRSTVISRLLQTKQFNAEGSTLKHISGGEIDILDTESRYWNTPKQIVRQALDTAVEQQVFGQRMPMVTPAGLVATKLGRAITNLVGSDQDQVDIINVLKKYGYQDLSRYDLTAKMVEEYKRLIARAKSIQDQPLT